MKQPGSRPRHQWTRRRFLVTTAAGSGWIAGGSLMRAATPGAGVGKSVLVDTHLHCFAGLNDPRFPYHDKAPYRPEEAATPEQLIRCMVEGGIEHAIVVHPEPYQDDHRYLEHCLEVGRGRLKGTCTLSYPHRKPDAIIQRLIEAYGADRLICGGGFGAGASGESYRAAFEKTRSYLASLSTAEQAKILGSNAVKLFGFPVPP